MVRVRRPTGRAAGRSPESEQPVNRQAAEGSIRWWRSRHRLATLLLSLVGMSLIAGCGYRLRGDVDIPPGLAPVYIQADGLVGQAIDDRLLSSGVPITPVANDAGLILRILDQSRGSRVVAVDRGGKALAFALELEVRFDALDAAGEPLIPPQQLTLERTFDDNPDVAVLGKQLESDIIDQDLANAAADQMLLRLRAALAARSAQ